MPRDDQSSSAYLPFFIFNISSGLRLIRDITHARSSDLAGNATRLGFLHLRLGFLKTKCKKLCTFVFALPRPPPIKIKVSWTVRKASDCCTGNV